MDPRIERKQVAWDCLAAIIEDFDFKFQFLDEKEKEICYITTIGSLVVVIVGLKIINGSITPTNLFIRFIRPYKSYFDKVEIFNLSLKDPHKASKRLRNKLENLKKMK